MVWKTLKYLLIALFLTMFMILVFSDRIIPKVIYRPVPIDQDYAYKFSVPHNEGFISKPSGGALNFIQLKALNPKGAMLYFHGNKDNLIRWGEIASLFTQYDYDVFVLDYSGYGKSTGTPSEQAILEDALIFYNYILKNFTYHDLIYIGRSLGSGVASYLSSIYPPKSLILETPYDFFGDVVNRFYPLFEYSDHYPKQLHNSELLKNSDFPILILHGTDDGLIPLDFAQQLYENIKRSNVTFTVIEGGAHNDLADYELYHKSMANFLR